MKKTSKKESGGFTILESLTAIFILVLVVTATFAATQTSLSNAIYAKDQVAGFFLANEAVEHLKNVRDSNILGGFNWLRGIAETSADPCHFTKYCQIDATTAVVSSCGTTQGNCPVLRKSTSGVNLYGYNSGWAATPYRREIRLSSVSANEVLATVTVTFSKGLTTKTITIKESIFNWQ